jgi:hypothetical protein
VTLWYARAIGFAREVNELPCLSMSSDEGREETESRVGRQFRRFTGASKQEAQLPEATRIRPRPQLGHVSAGGPNCNAQRGLHERRWTPSCDQMTLLEVLLGYIRQVQCRRLVPYKTLQGQMLPSIWYLVLVSEHAGFDDET